MLYHSRFPQRSPFIFQKIDHQSMKEYQQLREAVQGIGNLNFEKDNKETHKTKIQTTSDEAVKAHGKQTEEAEKEVVKERETKEKAAVAKMREELGEEPAKDSKEHAAWKTKWDALWQERIVPLQQEEAQKKGALWKEHETVKSKIYSMRDIAKKQVDAVYKAHENAKQEIGRQVEEAMKMELDREDLRELEELKKMMFEAREGGFFFVFGPGYDFGEIDYGDSEVNGVDLDDSEVEEMTQWIVALNGRDGAGKERMKAFIKRLKEREESSPEFDERLFFEDVKLELLSEMGHDISSKDARMLAMDTEPAKLIDEIAASDKIPKKLKGVLLGKLLKSDAGNVREMYKHMAAMGMDDDVSVEKAYAVFLALEYGQSAKEYRYWTTSYEEFKAITGVSDPTCESMVGETSAVKMKKDLETFKEAYQKAYKAYKASEIESLKSNEALTKSRELYKYYEAPFAYDEEVSALSEKKMPLSEFMATVGEYKKRAESLDVTPDLTEKVISKRDAFNKDTEPLRRYQELCAKYPRIAKARRMPALAGDYSALSDSTPEGVKAGIAKAAEKIEADAKIVTENLEKMEKYTKPYEQRGKGGGGRGYGGGAPAPRSAPKPQPKQVDPSELMAKAEVKWEWKENQPEGYKVDVALKSKPEWVERFEKDKEKKTGWVEVQRGKDRVLAHVEQDKDKGEVKIAYYEEEKKAA